MVCSKCGAQVSGKYCSECGARLKNPYESNYQDLQRWYRSFRKEQADTYPLWIVADGCWQAAKAMQRRNSGAEHLKKSCTEQDIKEIVERTKNLYEHALKEGGFLKEA